MNRIRPLCLALLTLPLVALAATPIDQSKPLRPDGQVRIDNVKGSVQVRTWDRAEVHVGGTLGDGVKALSVQGGDGAVRIKVEYPHGGGWFGGGGSEPSDLIVDVPARAELEIDVVSADVDVVGIAGKRLAIDSVSGGIRARGQPARAEIASVSGAVEVDLETSRLQASTVSGRLRASNPRGGEIALETVSGSIALNAGSVTRLSLESVSGSADAELQALAAGGRIDAETLSGRLRLSLPAATSAALSISTFSGDIRSAVGEVERERYGPGASLEARLGEGDGRIDLESFSGSVRLDLR